MLTCMNVFALFRVNSLGPETSITFLGRRGMQKQFSYGEDLEHTKIVIAPERSSIDCVQVACWLVSVRILVIFMDACYAHNDEDYRNS